MTLLTVVREPEDLVEPAAAWLAAEIAAAIDARAACLRGALGRPDARAGLPRAGVGAGNRLGQGGGVLRRRARGAAPTTPRATTAWCGRRCCRGCRSRRRASTAWRPSGRTGTRRPGSTSIGSPGARPPGARHRGGRAHRVAVPPLARAGRAAPAGAPGGGDEVAGGAHDDHPAGDRGGAPGGGDRDRRGQGRRVARALEGPLAPTELPGQLARRGAWFLDRAAAAMLTAPKVGT